jgi:hypothetical protein
LPPTIQSVSFACFEKLPEIRARAPISVDVWTQKRPPGLKQGSQCRLQLDQQRWRVSVNDEVLTISCFKVALVQLLDFSANKLEYQDSPFPNM